MLCLRKLGHFGKSFGEIFEYVAPLRELSHFGEVFEEVLGMPLRSGAAGLRMMLCSALGKGGRAQGTGLTAEEFLRGFLGTPWPDAPGTKKEP